MPFSTCGPDRLRGSRHGRWAGLGLAALMIFHVFDASAAVHTRPWVRAGAGTESDLVVDPSLPQVVIPGGNFVSLAPGVGAWDDASTGWRWGATTQFPAQFFLESTGRTLLAPSAWGELEHGVGRWGVWRLGTGLQAYDDSERESVRRLGTNAEMVLGLRGSTWRLEAIGGVDLRRYPRLKIADDRGRLVDYTESGTSAGLRLRLAPNARLRLDATASHLWTDARDPAYDADAWSAQGRLSWWPSPQWEFETAFVWQERSPEDPLRGEDSYDQFGAGVQWAFSEAMQVGLRVAQARYRWPEGEDTDTTRFEFAFTRHFGARRAPRPNLDLERPEVFPHVEENGEVHFRLHAPAATRVEVVGSFTQWRQGRALSHSSEGWWELTLPLSPGVYEYVFVVDGAFVTPPEATVTVDDGFGGRNGLLEVPDL